VCSPQEVSLHALLPHDNGPHGRIKYKVNQYDTPVSAYGVTGVKGLPIRHDVLRQTTMIRRLQGSVYRSTGRTMRMPVHNQSEYGTYHSGLWWKGTDATRQLTSMQFR
jgi:hypothetical protein